MNQLVIFWKFYKYKLYNFSQFTIYSHIKFKNVLFFVGNTFWTMVNLFSPNNFLAKKEISFFIEAKIYRCETFYLWSGNHQSYKQMPVSGALKRLWSFEASAFEDVSCTLKYHLRRFLRHHKNLWLLFLCGDQNTEIIHNLFKVWPILRLIN